MDGILQVDSCNECRSVYLARFGSMKDSLTYLHYSRDGVTNANTHLLQAYHIFPIFYQYT